jgi:hypothetical protein
MFAERYIHKPSFENLSQTLCEVVLQSSVPEDIVEWYSWKLRDGLTKKQLHMLRHIIALKVGWINKVPCWIVRDKNVKININIPLVEYKNYDLVHLPYPDTYYITRKYCERILQLYDRPFTYLTTRNYGIETWDTHGNCTIWREKNIQFFRLITKKENTFEKHENFEDFENFQDFKEVKSMERSNPLYKVYVTSPFDDSKKLCNFFKKCTVKGINFVFTDVYDYSDEKTWCVIINKPQINFIPNLSRSIIFQMEPNYENSNWHTNYNNWTGTSEEDKNPCNYYLKHEYSYNNLEWHVNKTSDELQKPITKSKTLSAVLSSAYTAPGHKLRIDFWKYFQDNCENLQYDLYGRSNSHNLKRYKGNLPHWNKDDGLFPYKYIFNAENCSIDNYFTEKLVDGILCECLTFYWGCTNLEKYLTKGSYIPIDITDCKTATKTILDAINNDLYEKNYPYIMECKKRILFKLQVGPRINNILLFKDVQIFIVDTGNYEYFQKKIKSLSIQNYNKCDSESEALQLLYNRGNGLILLRDNVTPSKYIFDTLISIIAEESNVLLNVTKEGKDILYDATVDLDIDVHSLHSNMCYYMNHETVMRCSKNNYFNVLHSIKSNHQWKVLCSAVCSK